MFFAIIFAKQFSVGNPNPWELTTFLGYCLDSWGYDQNTGAEEQDSTATMEDCLDKCLQAERAAGGATGCEYQEPTGRCWLHTADVKIGNGNSDSKCIVFGKAGSAVFPK